jgi:hypothetical protein
MKKIPNIFEIAYQPIGCGPKIDRVVTSKVRPGLEEVMQVGTATVKYDGTSCAVINNVLHRRYDAKKGKYPPKGAVPCCAPDPVTGHWPHWIPIGLSPADRYHREANIVVDRLDRGMTPIGGLEDGTYELVGPHFQSNPYGLELDLFIRHGKHIVEVERTFEGIKEFLTRNNIEGLVFWLNSEPCAKIRRADFNLNWNGKCQ